MVRKLEGWGLTGGSIALLLALVAVVFLVSGWNEAAVRTVVRLTARWSVVLFLLAFTAASLCRMHPSAATKWLLRNRRYVGVAFALSHFVHLFALVMLARFFPDPFVGDLDAVTLVGGGIAYGLIAAMAITSTDRAVAAMGRTGWRRLHLVGSYYIWILFAQSYVPRAFVEPSYIPVALLVVLGIVVRIVFRPRTRRHGEAIGPAS